MPALQLANAQSGRVARLVPCSKLFVWHSAVLHTASLGRSSAIVSDTCTHVVSNVHGSAGKCRPLFRTHGVHCLACSVKVPIATSPVGQNFDEMLMKIFLEKQAAGQTGNDADDADDENDAALQEANESLVNQYDQYLEDAMEKSFRVGLNHPCEKRYQLFKNRCLQERQAYDAADDAKKKQMVATWIRGKYDEYMEPWGVFGASQQQSKAQAAEVPQTFKSWNRGRCMSCFRFFLFRAA